MTPELCLSEVCDAANPINRRPDTPVLLDGRIYWSMYYEGRLYWIKSKHYGYQELPPAQELDRVREIDRQRLKAFLQGTRKCPQFTETDLAGLVRTQIRENQKLRLRFKSGDIAAFDTENEVVQAVQATLLPVPDGVIISQFVGRDWSAYDGFPNLEYSLQPAPIFSFDMTVVDLQELHRPAVLSANDQLATERLFGRILPFEQLDLAIKWGPDARRDPGRMTYARAARQKWCSSRDPAALKARFARFGYGEPYITQAIYFRLEDHEKAFQSSPPEIKEERRRGQTRNRVADWRGNLSQEARDRIRWTDRQRKNQQRKRPRKICQGSVTDTCPKTSPSSHVS